MLGPGFNLEGLYPGIIWRLYGLKLGLYGLLDLFRGYDVIYFTPSFELMVTFSPKRRKVEVAPKPDNFGSFPLVS